MALGVLLVAAGIVATISGIFLRNFIVSVIGVAMIIAGPFISEWIG